MLVVTTPQVCEDFQVRQDHLASVFGVHSYTAEEVRNKLNIQKSGRQSTLLHALFEHR